MTIVIPYPFVLASRGQSHKISIYNKDQRQEGAWLPISPFNLTGLTWCHRHSYSSVTVASQVITLRVDDMR
jgi:hypothetical protein